MKATRRQAKEIHALKRMKDRDIDLSDIPPLKNWDKAVIGKFYRPRKKSLTIRIDADVLAKLKSEGKGYQTRINALLRKVVFDKEYRADARRRSLPGQASRGARR